MFVQQLDPVADSLSLSALVAALPLVTVLVLLGGVRMRAHYAGPIGLVVAALVACLPYGMPVGQTVSSAAQGALFGLFPILWIVVNALWVYRMTVRTDHFDVLRRSFGRLSDDPRVQALVIAFCFGALLEALAGFGAPVAICSVMLVALGFDPVRAAVVALVANTAPVAFGAMATPVVTLAQVTGLPLDSVASVVGRQTPLLALVVPLLLVALVDGRRGLRETWVPALSCGVAFAIAQFTVSNYLSVQLADIAAALVGAAVLMAVPAARRPAEEPVRAAVLTGVRSDDLDREDPRREVVRAYAPYALIVAIFSIAQIGPVKDLLAKATRAFDWPFLDVAGPDGKAVGANVFSMPLIATGGTLVLVAGVATAAALKVTAADALREWAATVRELRHAILTVTSVLALAYVMNLSGQAATIGHFVAAAGAGLAFLSPVLGWFGVAVSGSDTSANALFGALQVTAARESGLSPDLLAAANSSGGVLGKMISPQNLTIACAAVGLKGREGDLLRKVLPWSLALLLVMCLIVVAQSSFLLGWMLP
ncbi:L-lactate permease [Streptomyces rapamycinicus]|uniref:L-lactate permease n=2 Tax=Streptomyces rapamycinicus TaxID=1226757 RepID=A0A0A0NJI9_STRRN|nr:L-lactate permease [Streptomyces rapamycinicus]AGP57351.1 lactate transporter LctP family protein [Streptomyces rapamycinicus NRRL 5491]MBB4784997.1 lactate permease [Streptomyces rapamycinicus]RLV79526.1 lactate transporter [Streptomyces rapamycinicus NRRL 5491]UTO65234.1 L-lactate permease [Streptomyces rapamycinicus]UTP33190.1 L-lactate permease [Streptomyces rapamycinicus NRRL 5491]